MSTEAHEVRKACQPPAVGGSFLVRRETSVCQSIACTSTLKPAFSSSDFATGARLLSETMSVDCMMHQRRAVIAGFLQQRARLGEVGVELVVEALGRLERRAAGEQRLAFAVLLGVADHRLSKSFWFSA